MSLTESTMIPLGFIAPNFELPDVVSEQEFSSDQLNDEKPLLVMFICHHCPYVEHIQHGIAEFAHEYEQKLNIVAISSNDVQGYPDDSPSHLKRQALAQGFIFPYLYDESQEVAKSYSAACTPDFFLFDNTRKLVYRGQFDASRPGNETPVTGESLRQAVEALLSGQEVASDQKPSAGCNIKWKPGNKPEYVHT